MVPSQYCHDPEPTYLSQTLPWMEDIHPPWCVYTLSSPKQTLSSKEFNQRICPVHAVVLYLTIRGNHSGPVFTFSDGRMLTREIFGLELDCILGKLNLKVHHYNTHSFRIGAATSAKQADISNVHIKTLGRWQSDAYQRYIRTPPQQLANISKYSCLKHWITPNRHDKCQTR